MEATLFVRKLAAAGDGAGPGPSTVTTSVSPGSSGGTLENIWPFDIQSGAFLHFISHLGLGQACGFLHSHLHTGCAQTWRQGWSSFPHTILHDGLPHSVLHAAQSSVGQKCLGQTTLQLGCPHFILQLSVLKPLHRVEHTGWLHT